MLACAVPTGRRIAAAVVFILFAVPAFAQGQKSGEEAYALASPPSNPTDQAPSSGTAAPPPDESAVLGSILTFDPAALAAAPLKQLKQPSLGDRDTFAVTRTNSQPDGSGTVSLKQGVQQPLPTDWNAYVGADLGLASTASPMATDSLGQPLPTMRDGRSSGAAWATIGINNLASLDARVDPTNDQGRIGTTLQRSIPFGSRFSLTVQDTYSVTESHSNPGVTGPGDIPMMSLPTATPGAAQVWDNQRGVKFGILPTGTTLGASTATSSIDPETHNTFSAEQSLLGPLHVTTAVTDIGKPTESKSIAAGAKVDW
jgi:hypothetical protein